MTFNKLKIKADTTLITTEGTTLAAGVHFMARTDLQWLQVGNTHFNIILYAWTDVDCCDAGKPVLSLEGIHDAIDISVSDEFPVYKSFSYEIKFQIEIADETDVDTDAKVQDLVIAELASTLSKVAGDFSVVQGL